MKNFGEIVLKYDELWKQYFRDMAKDAFKPIPVNCIYYRKDACVNPSSDNPHLKCPYPVDKVLDKNSGNSCCYFNLHSKRELRDLFIEMVRQSDNYKDLKVLSWVLDNKSEKQSILRRFCMFLTRFL